MTKLYALIAILCFVIAILQGFQPEYRQSSFDKQIQQELNDVMLPPINPGVDKSGRIKEIGSQNTMTEHQIDTYIQKRNKEKALTWYWHFGKPYNAAASGLGTDGKHHFVNAYLKNFVPFHTDQIWMPMYAIATRLTYQLDSKHYGGLEDVWQTSIEAFTNTRGDCEDHALLLADWLNGIGVEARVVIGTYDGGGHAWVVAFENGEEYLLEATSKRKLNKWKHYPIAALIKGYAPHYMFNKDYFWVNTGDKQTRQYSGSHWKKVSKYISSL